MRILVTTTLAAFVMDQEDTWSGWLQTAEEMVAEGHRRDDEVHFFVALEIDARGVEPFAPLLARLDSLCDRQEGAYTDYWVYGLDDGRTEVTTGNRLRHIVAGQNLCNDFAVAGHYDFMMFMAADCKPPADAPWRLIETHRTFGAEMVGGEVTTYCLSGPDAWEHYGVSDCEDICHPPEGCCNGQAIAPYPAEAHMPTAAFVLLSRLAFRKLRWRWDFEDGSDDPCLYADALARGYRVVVRKDVVGKHYPESIGAIETRGHDMKVVR
jgi:hypothetical protein